MHCEVSGTGAIALICIHGWGCDGGQFAGLARALDPDFRVFRPDLPGHGATPLESFTPSFGTYSGWIADFVENRGLQNPILLGHSMGGILALLTAARLRPRAVINLDGPLPDTDQALDGHAIIRRRLDETDFRVRLAGPCEKLFFCHPSAMSVVKKLSAPCVPRRIPSCAFYRNRSALSIRRAFFPK